MTAAQHTPGPWTVTRTREISAPTPQDSPVILPTITICEVWSGGAGIEGADANARLIAAAPDLLAFAKSLIDAWESDGMPPPYEIAKAARAAIAKATGEAA